MTSIKSISAQRTNEKVINIHFLVATTANSMNEEKKMNFSFLKSSHSSLLCDVSKHVDQKASKMLLKKLVPRLFHGKTLSCCLALQ